MTNLVIYNLMIIALILYCLYMLYISFLIIKDISLSRIDGCEWLSMNGFKFKNCPYFFHKFYTVIILPMSILYCLWQTLNQVLTWYNLIETFLIISFIVYLIISLVRFKKFAILLNFLIMGRTIFTVIILYLVQIPLDNSIWILFWTVLYAWYYYNHKDLFIN